MNEVTGEVRESFSLFTVDPAWKEFLRNFPPVSAPFGEYQASPGANILMTQKIGNIITNYPLCMIGEDQGSRTAIFAAEGIWKWRYFNFEENKNFAKQIQTLKEKPIKNALGFTLMAPYYDLDGKTLWGATAMMVSELCTIIKQQDIIIR